MCSFFFSSCSRLSCHPVLPLASIFTIFFCLSISSPVSLSFPSCWFHCYPRWWLTEKTETLRDRRVHPTLESREISDPLTCKEDTLIWVEVPGLGSQDLHYVPEEVYRRPGAQGHHWDLSPRGEGSAWAEEARKFTGTGLQLVKGEPQEKVHH